MRATPLAAGAICLTIAAIVAVRLIPGALAERSLAARGIPSTATVVGKRAYTWTERSLGRPRAYALDYEFTLAAGDVWAGSRNVSRAEWNRLDEGDRFGVRYDPANPDRNVVVRATRSLPSPATFALTGVLATLGGALLYLGLAGNAARRAAPRPADARITAPMED